VIVLLDGKRIGTVDRRKKQDSIFIKVPHENMKVSIFVENLGRINFGKYLTDNRKGITENVLFAGTEVTGWKMYGFPFNSIDRFKYKKQGKKQESHWPVLRKGFFELDEVADTYLDMSQFGKGSVWVNGHHIGRYWQVGPQQTLYIPAPWLKKGKNEVVVFEMLKMWQSELRGQDHPVLDQLKEELFTGPTSVQQIEY
jgi:beta-galactosidase